MKILVAGMGLIGGSICLSLKRAGYSVDGWNRSKSPLEYAVNNNIISSAAQNFCDYDIVFVALPPEASAKFICTNAFKDGAIVSDICGVKEFLEREVYSAPRNFKYVGCHPMAGKEVAGIKNASAELFDGASMVITVGEKTDKAAYESVFALSREMGFKRVVRCSAKVHDEKIAYTSQLAHVVSNAYVKDGEISACFGFTGGSFQDMTRIAGVEEGVWASLYLLNAKNLSKKIKTLVASLEEINAAIEKNDRAELEKTLKRGRDIYLSRREDKPSGEIEIINLK